MLLQWLRPIALALFLTHCGPLISAPQVNPVGQSQSPADVEWAKWFAIVQQKALEYSDTLPDFICVQTTRRFSATGDTFAWITRDVLEAELSFNQKTERYSRIRLNGKPKKGPIESLGGAWSIGEFGSLLRTLFLPETQAEFASEGNEQLQDITAIIMKFRVSTERSRWTLSFENSHSLNVAYHGRVWVDASNHQILKINQRTFPLPPTFPITYSEITTLYNYVSVSGLEGKKFLLPQTAHVILHQRQPPIRSLNVIDFRDYRKFTADVRLVPE